MGHHEKSVKHSTIVYDHSRDRTDRHYPLPQARIPTFQLLYLLAPSVGTGAEGVGLAHSNVTTTKRIPSPLPLVYGTRYNL